jgi:hypothetical protein
VVALLVATAGQHTAILSFLPFLPATSQYRLRIVTLTIESGPPMPFISVTRLRLRSWVFFPAFFFDAFRSARQARAAQGNIAVKVLQDARNTWWTCSAWDAEDSMRNFMRAKPHGPAMRKLLHWCDEASIVHWIQPEGELPSWPEAHRRMQLEGRSSKVNYPSPEHIVQKITAPVVNSRADINFK